jgi:hypothetical protein
MISADFSIAPKRSQTVQIDQALAGYGVACRILGAEV